jgi:hypothetical protein
LKSSKLLPSILGMALLGSLFISPVYAGSTSDGDKDKRSRTVGTATATYINDTVYTASKCGMSAKAVYSAYANKTMDGIGISYEVYSLFDEEDAFDSDSASDSNTSRVSMVSKETHGYYKSEADFDFARSGSTWSPFSRVYNCAENPSSRAYRYDSLKQDSVDYLIQKIDQYELNQESLTRYNQRSVSDKKEDILLEIAELLFKDQETKLKKYGVDLSDLKIVETPYELKNVDKFVDEFTGIEIENNEESELIKVVHFKPILTKEGNQSYVVLPYAFVDQTNKRVDTGIIAEELETSKQVKAASSDLNLSKIPSKMRNGEYIRFDMFEDSPKNGKYYYSKNNDWWYERDYGGHGGTYWKLKHRGSNEYWSFTSSGKIIRYKKP